MANIDGFLTSCSKCRHAFPPEDRVCKLSIDVSMPYFDFNGTTLFNNAVSGSIDENIQGGVLSNGTPKYDFTKISEVLRYCYDRLAEIECINCVSHTISSIGCIAAFIGFLSRLIGGDNTRSGDKDLFVQFVKEYMPVKYAGHEDLLYGTLRCGILHSMSFHDTIDSFQHQNKSMYPTLLDCRKRLVVDDTVLEQFHAQSNKLLVDHDVAPNINGKLRTTATGQYRLSAFELCKDVRLALDKVCTEATPNSPLEKRIFEFVRIQVPITTL